MKIICEKGYHAGNVLRLVAEYLEKRYPDDMILDENMEITLSLACMINTDTPSARQGRITFPFSSRYSLRIFQKVFFPNRNASTQAQDIAWEMTVARAAPRTSIFSPKIKIGSKIILATAPIRTDSIPVFANP